MGKPDRVERVFCFQVEGVGDVMDSTMIRECIVFALKGRAEFTVKECGV